MAKVQVPALKEVLKTQNYKPGDVMVVFGEIFSRGYANGILDEATKAGLTVIRSTVGRRDSDDTLRPLNADELSAQPKPFINVPLEAGFDLEKAASGRSPVDQLAGVKMNDWDQVKLNWDDIRDSQKRAEKSFVSRVEKYFSELEKLIPKGKNVLFVHTMAGGVPRAKILMPTMNKIFKGQGDRHIGSARLQASDLGKFSEMNFEEVTANTFKHLLDLSGSLRSRIEKDGGRVSYVAYGYHGTEILIGNEFRWQTYTPYFQGWAKIKLENYAKEYSAKGLRVCVYNCPEILTNSSSIFLGVEVSLYPLLGALEKQTGKHASNVLDKAKAMLKPEHSFAEILKFCNEYVLSDIIQAHSIFEKWPQHNSKDQMEKMLQASEHLLNMHKNDKELITYLLSEEVFRATGYLMFRDAWAPLHPVSWLGHDVLAPVIAAAQ